jgi:hypothetical protein
MANKDRLAEIEKLPEQLREDALLPWATVALMCGADDVESCRENLLRGGLKVVELSERRKLPRLGTLRAFLREREK